MIFVFSKKDDYSTNQILNWLHFHNEEFIRINDEKASSIKYQKLFEQISNKSVHSAHSSQPDPDPDVFWFRRPDSNVIAKLGSKNIKIDDIIYPKFSDDKVYFNSLNNDYYHYLRTFAHLILDDKDNRIGSYYNNSMNKVNVLKKAEQIGIDIPPYLVTSDIDTLKVFFNENDCDIICKSLFEIVFPIGVKQAGFLLRGLTSQITDLSTLPQEFFPSLFQKNIHKEFEIRTFFLDGKCYSAAMFTQQNEKTRVDFRNYDNEKPTRIIPYQLDEDLEDKISKLMDAVGLNTGSIDIMKGLDGKYYFLEINPIGQFEFISTPCNYNIPKLIAESLIKKHNGRL